MTKNTYTKNEIIYLVESAKLLSQVINMSPEESHKILTDIVASSAYTKSESIDKNVLYSFIGQRDDVYRDSKEGKVSSIDHNDHNPLINFTIGLLTPDFSNRYGVIEAYLFYDKGEIWFIADKISIEILSSFDKETYEFQKKNGYLNITPLIIGREEIDFSELPPYDKKIGV